MTTRLAPILVSLVCVSLCAGLGGCSGESSDRDAKAPAAAAAGDRAAAVEPAGQGGNAAELPSRPASKKQYELTLDVPEDATSGADVVVAVKVTPVGTWHLNEEYSTSLKVVAPEGVALAHDPQLEKDDAKELTEAAIAFDVKFVPDAAGDKSFTGKLKFAVCEEDVCQPVAKDIAFEVAVK